MPTGSGHIHSCKNAAGLELACKPANAQEWSLNFIDAAPSEKSRVNGRARSKVMRYPGASASGKKPADAVYVTQRTSINSC